MTERTNDMEPDLRSRVVTLEHASADKNQRLSALEQWRTTVDIASARRDVAFENLVKTVDNVDKKIDGMAGNMTWIVRLIIGGIILGVIAFMIRGGFKIP